MSLSRNALEASQHGAGQQLARNTDDGLGLGASAAAPADW